MTGGDDMQEMVSLAAVDGVFYSHLFFEKTVRQGSPAFHRSIWKALENPSNRYVDTMVFRGGAKTTLLRLFTSKRIALALSRTILYIGKSEGHAARSVNWLKKQVEFNSRWAQTYGLRKGSVWTATEIEILHEVEGITIRVLAMGITGSVRGINIDDYRPDLIVLDDIQDEENSATPEQRAKIEDLVFGALKESLAPASECPDAMMAMLQTPLDQEDIISKCQRDPEWVSLRFGTFTAETEDVSIEGQESIWPERWPSKVLREEKLAAFARNQASLWYRERECKLVSRETSDFDVDWVQYWTVLPERMTTVMVIDPVPPPTEKAVRQGLAKKDFEVLNVLGVKNGQVFDIEYAANKGHEPDWTIAKFFELKTRWRPRKCIILAYNYEQTLKWLLDKAMRQRREYLQIETVQDRRSKRDRIVDGLNGVLSSRHFYVKSDMVELIDQIRNHPSVSHDDVIETAAMGAEALLSMDYIDAEYEELELEEEGMPTLVNFRSAP